MENQRSEDKGSITMTCLNDCERFLKEFFPVLSTAWAQVYDSALAFSPLRSTLRQLHSFQSSKLMVINGPHDWDVSSWIIERHSHSITSIQFSPDGKRILSASQDKTVRLWDTISGAHLNTFEGHKDYVHSAAFSPDGDYVVSGSEEFDASIRLWDTVSGTPLKVFGCPSRTFSVMFSPDGRKVSYIAEDKLNLWDPISGEILRVFHADLSPPRCIAFSPDGKLVASGSDSGIVQLWCATSGAHRATFKNHSHRVVSIGFSPDGARITSASWDMKICSWSLIGENRLMTLEGHTGYVHSVKFSPNGATIASGSADKTVRLWDAVSGALLLTLKGHLDSVLCVAFSPDGQYIVSGSIDKTIRLWDIDYIGSRTPRNSGFLPFLLGFLAFLFASLPYKTALRIIKNVYDVSSYPMHLNGHLNPVASMTLSHRAATLATTCDDGPPILWDAVSGARLKILRGHSNRVGVTAFSPNGTAVASGSLDRTIRLWDTASGATKKVLKGHQGSVISLVFSPDGNRIASGSTDGCIKIWDAHHGSHLLDIDAQGTPVVDIVFSPDSARMSAVLSAQCLVPLWDVASGRRFADLTISSGLRSVAFTPDGRRIIFSTEDELAMDLSRAGPSSGTKLNIYIYDNETGKKWNPDSPANWIPYAAGDWDLGSGNASRTWARVCGKDIRSDSKHTKEELTWLSLDFKTKHYYFMQDGWIWLVRPPSPQRLCWVPLTYRGRFGNIEGMNRWAFKSSGTRVAIALGNRGPLVIDFSNVIKPGK